MSEFILRAKSIVASEQNAFENQITTFFTLEQSINVIAVYLFTIYFNMVSIFFLATWNFDGASPVSWPTFSKFNTNFNLSSFSLLRSVTSSQTVCSWLLLRTASAVQVRIASHWRFRHATNAPPATSSPAWRSCDCSNPRRTDRPCPGKFLPGDPVSAFAPPRRC